MSQCERLLQEMEEIEVELDGLTSSCEHYCRDHLLESFKGHPAPLLRESEWSASRDALLRRRGAIDQQRKQLGCSP
jgi:hypothetical protein